MIFWEVRRGNTCIFEEGAWNGAKSSFPARRKWIISKSKKNKEIGVYSYYLEIWKSISEEIAKKELRKLRSF